ncbi:Cyclopropane-fatty-acyl-phospholipid synthase [Alkaliphilus metalliredigens QYMF]|uniref:Cyclopropane-fatty-acyl-phospholipid synthase n=1 Tax=Alkaliphilus metalliredigens (strain QYMF) TaxID=293826 RepID=A6TND7_ALKMQ|nr:class I SAM-dependent methyltransferase [Alkaliphilus metalliredigens]ABR47705.1 Cyclopropane-fatty-acyl-phospholipid synthase [Alkaliphilus metalliredigens QYMF]
MRDVEKIVYWKDAWEKKKMDTKKSEVFWDNRAAFFNTKVSLEKNESSDIIDLLLKKEMLHEEMSVLDIGCGPGKHTIPMARIVKKITALDISENMLNHLQNNAKKMNLDNIKTLKKDWKDIDLEKEGWNKAFDFVFASMTPGVFDFNTLEKMTKASKNYCFLSGFVDREDSIFDEVEAEISKIYSLEKRKDKKVYYAFNVLWHLGYTPEVFYLNREWEDIRTVEETWQLYVDKISMQVELKEEEKMYIKEELKKHQNNGKVKEKTKVKIGVLTWSV